MGSLGGLSSNPLPRLARHCIRRRDVVRRPPLLEIRMNFSPRRGFLRALPLVPVVAVSACTPPDRTEAETRDSVSTRAPLPDCIDASEQWLRTQVGTLKMSIPWKRTLAEGPGLYSERSAFGPADNPVVVVRTLDRSGAVAVRLQRRASDLDVWEGVELRTPDCAAHSLPSREAPLASTHSSMVLDNAATHALVASQPDAWILGISPDMPLSFDAIQPIYEIAKRRGVPLVLALAGLYRTELTKELEAKLHPTTAGEHAPAVYRMDPTNDLVLDGFANHYPNLALFKAGRFHGLVSGYKAKASYEAFITDTLAAAEGTEDEGHLVELRAILQRMRTIHLVVQNQEAIQLGLRNLGSYYRPIRERRALLFPRNAERELFVFDLETRTSKIVPTGPNVAPYDVVGLPFTQTVALIFSYQENPFSTSNAILDLSAPLAGGAPTFRSIYEQPSGNIYPSAGLIATAPDSRTYQVLTNWGQTEIRELRFRVEPQGLVFESQTEAIRLCSGISHSTPHVAPRGHFMTATVNGIGQLLEFDRGQRCTAAYDFGVPASKIDSNDDLSQFLFHGGYVHFDGAKFSSRSGGSFALDRASGLIQKINVGDLADASTTYPSFLSGTQVVYHSPSRTDPQTSLAVVLDLKRLATAP